MDSERLEELWAGFLAGQKPSEEDERELIRLLETDEAVREQLLNNAQMDSWLRAVRGGDLTHETVVRRFLDRLTAQRDEGRFIEKVQSRIRNASRSERPRTARPSFRRSGTKGPANRGPFYAIGGLVAAASILAALLVALGRAPSDSPKANGRNVAGGSAPPRPEGPNEAEGPRPPPPPVKAPDAPVAPPPKHEPEKRSTVPRVQPPTTRQEPGSPEAPPAAPRPPAPAPESPPKSRETTVSTVARVVRFEGAVTLLRQGTRVPVEPSASLLDGDGLESGSGQASASFAYGDGTRVDLGSGTVLRQVRDQQGKRLWLDQGSLSLEVSPQPPGKPLVIVTPHAEARVLGTTLRLFLDPDPKKGTRVEVIKGKVELKKLAGGTVDVVGGHYAVAGSGTSLVAKPLRSPAGLLALYVFREGRGATVRDVSGAGPSLDLQIANPSAVRWLRPRGLQVRDAVLIASAGPAAKIADACRGSNELTVEVWIRPADAPPSVESRVVTLSADFTNRDFTLGQGDLDAPMTAFAVRLRTTASDSNGTPILATPGGAATPRLTHVVYTRSASGAAAFYVDGAVQARGTSKGNFSNWDRGYRLALADEIAGERPWKGEYHLVALYGRALTADEVGLHYRVGAD